MPDALKVGTVVAPGIDSAGPGSPAWTDLVHRAGDPVAVVEAFEYIPAVLAYFEGPDLVVRAVNAMSRMLYSPGRTLGLPLRDAIPTVAGQELVEVVQRTWAEKRPFTGLEWRMQFDPADPDSEHFLTFTLTPWLHPDGRMRGILAHGFDVTREVQARRAAEARVAGVEQRLEATEQVLLTLQRHLLAEAVPVLPQVRLSAHYLVAATDLQAGGDWFDAIPLGGGRVALIVGDVVGHGAEAAAAMARLQTVLHEAMLSGASIADAVARLDAYAEHTPTTRAATVCVAVVDPGARTVTYISRAHPPPLVCRPNRPPSYLPDVTGSPLGVRGGPTSSVTAQLEPGAIVLLYSDGLIERAGETAAEGRARLARVAATALTSAGRTVSPSLPDRLTSLAVERITRMGYADDVTVLAAHLLPEPLPALTLDVTARPEELAALRDAVLAWLDPLQLRPNDRLAVQLAVWEAASNVVDHAYRGGSPGRIGVLAELDDTGRVHLVVDDDGRWQEGAGVTGGRGIGLMRAVCDEVVIDSGADGTRVAMRLRPQHPTVVGAQERTAAPAQPPAAEFRVTVTETDPPRVEVHGPVDASTAPQLRAAVEHHSAGPLVVDLSGVTFLASAGVQLLYDIADGYRVRVAAPTGSPARYVLDLTDLSSRLPPAT